MRIVEINGQLYNVIDEIKTKDVETIQNRYRHLGYKVAITNNSDILLVIDDVIDVAFKDMNDDGTFKD